MDLSDRLRELAARIPSQLDLLKTEEATKNALVMPFINALGYNVFDPTEVVPEFAADVGVKKGEKVDYALIRDGEPIVLVECKSSGTDLDAAHMSQLFRYFAVTPARIGILTNGVDYRLFSDLEAPNRMDEKPFLEFSVLTLNDRIVSEIKKLAKESFDVDQVVSAASDLKYVQGIARALRDESVSPSDRFVKLLTRRVYSGMVTQAVREQFRSVVKRAFAEFINDTVNARLAKAMEGVTPPTSEKPREQEPEIPEPAASETDQEKRSEIETTALEMEGFYIVKAILSEVIDPDRVFIRDTLSYCGVLLDDNNRKPICRLFFNSATKYIGLFDEDKKVERHAIQTTGELWGFAEQIKATALRHQ
ncbi:MAG: type I restriction endonuclease [Planctomycetota bacterium]